MTNATKPDNRIDYLEFPVLDMAAAKRFYAAVFGWTFTDYGAGYSSFSDGRLDGGFTLDGEPPACGVLVVIYARDLDAAQSRIREAGGKIVKETFSFPGGSRFHFNDPSGNELAVWSDQGESAGRD
jgi:hypothetical protein